MKGRPGANPKKPRQRTNFIRNRGERPAQPPVAITGGNVFPGRDRQKWDNASFLARPTLPAISCSFMPGVSNANWPCDASGKKRHGLQLRTRQ
jgi:hypothetical protein